MATLENELNAIENLTTFTPPDKIQAYDRALKSWAKINPMASSFINGQSKPTEEVKNIVKYWRAIIPHYNTGIKRQRDEDISKIVDLDGNVSNSANLFANPIGMGVKTGLLFAVMGYVAEYMLVSDPTIQSAIQTAVKMGATGAAMGAIVGIAMSYLRVLNFYKAIGQAEHIESIMKQVVH